MKNSRVENIVSSVLKSRLSREMTATRMNSGYTLSRNTDLLAVVTVIAPYEVNISVLDHHREAWLPKVLGVVEHSIRKAMAREGDALNGRIEIGTYGEQNSYSDDGFVAVWSDNARLAKGVIGVVDKYVPLSGGGVYGSHYRGSGQIKGGGNQYSYHKSSYGIGD